ncbi:TPA: fimbrial adhesin EcpD [Klebsiella pneumoniae]|uniref:fimbrial adhesin EcpD n=1 Tax=Klebsiella pneumoniae TaxID=573 RepID=UPI000A3CB16C|nr:fimbrial adhesin EcpD [Klebsiella pneumoniae]EIW8469295.1 hypothetical protein [Klebsiella pneumoniae]EKV3462427.1 fimbrial adhesin EcpD [Klebsiella pneumoniae]MBD7785994.1 fimbrial adhesin EcpD [Klebsiella pneumoniae]MBG2001102.1 fimbrial adhesin EcpD [Klebsiella pneumoniae]MBG2058747.1 fimbrial adhesin EcpD [Klebsiella pneumoniae]
MKVNALMALAILALLWPAAALRAAVTKTTWSDAPAREFVFVENNSDDNFFVTPGGALDPRMTGANRWTGLKYTGSGTIYQQSLGYIDNGYNTGLNANWKFDMWLENSPVSHPLTGLRCINWYAGCDMATSLILPQTTDASGFYGATVTSGGAKWMHGMMSDAFYQYLQQMPVGGSFTMTINACQTSVNYDASSGARCKDQASGNWYVRNVTHTKAANLRLINTHSLAEVFINSDGVPTLGEGNADCRTQTIGSRAGLSCKMVNYTLQTNGLSNTSIHIFPAIANSSLASAVGAYDMQFSLNGSSWKPVSNTAYYYTFNEMKSSDSIYVFFSSNFFKQMVNLGISDINTKDLFNFRFQNTTSPESGWYEFSTSNTLIIKPRDFSISIISDEYTSAPSREGYVGSGEPALDFGYIVTTSGKTAADEVLIKVTGPAQMIGGRSYCLFSSDDGTAKVPFPATLSFITRSGTTQTYDAGCDDSWRDMTDALWLTTPWTDISGEVGQMDKTTVKFSIPMDNAISLRTVDDNGWFGEVSASGEIHVQATWRNIN